MALAIFALVVIMAPLSVSLTSLPVLAVTIYLMAHGQPSGELLVVHEPSGKPVWRWREYSEQEWRDISLRCDYLGPWLIGLRVDGRKLWLWPDSSDPDSLRQLRRLLKS
ncbi:hypothetical protein [Halomonas urumqiensis]|uniref:Toxin CptA n=1 Tax=Halomonas urumqiensis TaxID=1684789 RepID=A0A2N7UQI7_9GAMM|nr:hypothetical protein [Halomonas urumqiensis]PMR82698.1 hypothetical protein C1H70_00085 [Halomonas urumqiensis]PTB01983.1 hypothetical protein C6V82_13115 [Halomonas urumqiensis]